MSQLTNRKWKTLPQTIQEALRLLGKYGNVAPAKQLAVSKPTEPQLKEAFGMVRRQVDRAEQTLERYYGYEHPSTVMSENVRRNGGQNEPEIPKSSLS